MAPASDYVLYACEQMSLAGTITYKYMFGGYAIYCDGKCFALIGDNTLYITPTKAGLAHLPDAIRGKAQNTDGRSGRQRISL